jgi:hypothetical protein
MLITKFDNFINEKYMIEMINESSIHFSKKFNTILNIIKDDEIAKILIDLENSKKDIEKLKHNFIDLSENPKNYDEITFIPDRKAQSMKGEIGEFWKVIESNRYLTHNRVNDKIFKELGYDKDANENWAPSEGIIGEIMAETVSQRSGRTYVLFREKLTSGQPRIAVLNKVALEPYDYFDEKIWTSGRNSTTVGKLSNAILKSSSIDFKDHQIEAFVNKYKSARKAYEEGFINFDIVSGQDIKYWYNSSRYASGGGRLQGSCMKDIHEEALSIYSDNSDVRMVIMYDEGGSVDSNGKYTSPKIRGRAILWKCEMGDNGQDITFMDRVYTTLDSEIELFTNFAEKNKWWWKKIQSYLVSEQITNGSSVLNTTLKAYLGNVDFDYYPYMDTLCYISTYGDYVTNDEEGYNCDRLARETDGTYRDI